MSEKKNIDKLFKEQFKDFEQAPNDVVWQRIEEELHKDKRKRRIIPIWWKFAGAAAVLVMLFTIVNVINGNFEDDPIQQKIVDTENQNDGSLKVDESLNKNNENELVKPQDNNPSETIDNTSIVTTEQSSETKTNQLLNNPSLATGKNETNKIASSQANESEQHQNTATIDKHKSRVKNALASANTNTSVNHRNTIDKSNSDKTSENANAITNTFKNRESEAKANTSPIAKEQSEIDKLLKDFKQSKETQVTSSGSVEKDNTNIAIDTTASQNLIEEENAIEKAIADANKEEDDIEEHKDLKVKRWSVAPNIAPVYFNTLGEGSSLDAQFVENSKEGIVSVSYGLKGSYALSKKLKIRAGVNKVDLGYSTNNVLIFDGSNPNTGARQMQNVDISNMETNSTFVSASTLSFSNGPEILNARERGSIEQQLGFIEVPIELEYSLLDKKFGVNLIGGFSSLFLNTNEVYSVESDGNRTLMGEATNIKDMSYSANFGIGVNYNISKQLLFNLEPTFKYQINTFSNTSGDFQPFFIGVYTGLSFKF